MGVISFHAVIANNLLFEYMLNILCKENYLITFLICSCHHPVTLSQNNFDDQTKENQDQSVKFGNIFISSASPQSQFSPMNQPPFYGPRPKYGSELAGFLEMLKFGYSEKATKFQKIFHLKFDATQ